jgi:hypothetical protein
LSYVEPVKSKAEISKSFVAFSEYMNFTRKADLYNGATEGKQMPWA